MTKWFYRVKRSIHNKKNNVLPFYASLCSMVLCMVCLAGTSWAWFTGEQSVRVASIHSSQMYIKQAEVSCAAETAARMMAVSLEDVQTISGGDAGFTVSSGNLADTISGGNIWSLVSGGDIWSSVSGSQTVSGNDAVQAVSGEDAGESVSAGDVSVPVGMQDIDSFSFQADADTLYTVNVVLGGNAKQGYLAVKMDNKKYYMSCHPIAGNPMDGIQIEFELLPATAGEIVVGVIWGAVPQAIDESEIYFENGNRLGDGHVQSFVPEDSSEPQDNINMTVSDGNAGNAAL